MKLAAETKLYSRVRWGLCVGLALVAAIPATAHLVDATRPRIQAPPSLENRSITAPGRIQPRDGVVTLAAPTTAFGAAIVDELRVQEGDRVERSQVIAVLKGRSELEAEVLAAERRVDVATARLAALRSAGKREDIRALQAEVQADEANLAQIAADSERTRQLHVEHVVSAAALEAQQSRWSVATRMLEAKRARVDSLSNARPADLAIAEAELSAARADAEAARTKLANQYVRAPSTGRVLRINAYPGQAVGSDGVVAFAQTEEMFVEAEVVESDIPRAQCGQTVRITGDSLAAPLHGTVERIGTWVGAREVFASDPTAFSDSRVVRVLIRVSESSVAERFINARVTVEIAS